MNILKSIKAYFDLRHVSGSLPNADEIYKIALTLSDKLEHSEREQAMFVAGFLEGIKWFKQSGNVH